MFRRLLLALTVFPAIGVLAALTLLLSPTGSGVQAQGGTPTPRMVLDANVLEDGIQATGSLWVMDNAIACDPEHPWVDPDDPEQGHGCLRVDKVVEDAYGPWGVGAWSEYLHYTPAKVWLTPEPDPEWLETTPEPGSEWYQGRTASCLTGHTADDEWYSECLTGGGEFPGPIGSGRIEKIYVYANADAIRSSCTLEDCPFRPAESSTMQTVVNNDACILSDIRGVKFFTEGYPPSCQDATIDLHILPADFNLTCRVTISDVQAILGRFYPWGEGVMPYDPWYDVWGEYEVPDGKIDLYDLAYTDARRFNQACDDIGTCNSPGPCNPETAGQWIMGQSVAPSSAAATEGSERFLALSELGPTLSIEPQSQEVIGLNQDFTVDVMVNDVGTLGGYQFSLVYDPNILEFVGLANGSFLGSSGRSVDCTPITSEAGIARIACATSGVQVGPEGSGQLARITLRSLATGSTPLQLTNVALVDPVAYDIPASTQDGSASVLLPPPANFTTQPCGSHGCAQVSDLYFTWDAVPGATYQLCGASDVFMQQKLTCYDVPGTSWSVAPPTTSSKIVRYWAVRTIAGGQTSDFSKRGGYIRFTESVEGIPIDAYWTLYKTGPWMKMVNGWAFQTVAMVMHNNSVPPNWMCAGYPDRGCEASSASWANGLWFTSNQPWDAPDYVSVYGPLVAAFASPYDWWILNDWGWLSTALMWGDATTDSDLDGVLDAADNCPSVYNPDQANNDRRRPNGSQIPGDWASNPVSGRLGDACDADDDNDHLVDTSENVGMCPYVMNADSDGDRIRDYVEISWGYNACSAASKPVCNSSTDSDADGITDCIEMAGYDTYMYLTDSDGDSCPDWLEIMDLNGDRNVSVGDQTLLAQRIAGVRPPSDSDPLFDVNKDGRIDSGDNGMMARNTCSYKQQHGYTGPCPCPPEP